MAVTVTKTNKVVTERKLSPVGASLARFLHDAVALATEDELPGLSLLILKWLKDQEYELQGTPEEMLKKLQDLAV